MASFQIVLALERGLNGKKRRRKYKKKREDFDLRPALQNIKKKNFDLFQDRDSPKKRKGATKNYVAVSECIKPLGPLCGDDPLRSTGVGTSRVLLYVPHAFIKPNIRQQLKRETITFIRVCYGPIESHAKGTFTETTREAIKQKMLPVFISSIKDDDEDEFKRYCLPRHFERQGRLFPSVL